ncbi:MAG: YkvA family protein [Candidatus Aminicenantes bacterium]|nr:YkvA family protein [Candidatus Aminicenantes bacterium]
MSSFKIMTEMKKPILDKLKNRAANLRNEIFALSLAVKDKRTPLLAKVLIALSVSYALSPIDLIPDFIPVFGYFDDLILLPAIIAFALKLIPKEVLEACRTRAQEIQVNKKLGWIAAVWIIIFWLIILILIVRKIIS